jgi:hypothetical protein
MSLVPAIKTRVIPTQLLAAHEFTAAKKSIK